MIIDRNSIILRVVENYYQILSVPKDCDQQSLKQSYRKLVLNHHPDLSTAANAHEQFIRIDKAYKTLSDSRLRLKYDYLLDSYELGQRLYNARNNPRPHANNYSTTVTTVQPRWKTNYPVKEIITGIVFITITPSLLIFLLMLVFGVHNDDLVRTLTQYEWLNFLLD